MERLITLLLLFLGLICISRADISEVNQSSEEEEDSGERRRCGMEQYEADIRQTYGVVPRTSKPGVSSGRFYFDSTNKRMLTSVNMTNIDGTKFSMKVYMSPVEMNVFIPSYNVCYKLNVTSRIERCLPDDAVKTGERRYGDVSEPLTAEVWTMRDIKPGFSDLFIEMAISGDGFLVSAVSMGKIMDEPYLRNDEMFNFKRGIVDPSVFDLPEACRTATLFSNGPEPGHFTTNPFE